MGVFDIKTGNDDNSQHFDYSKDYDNKKYTFGHDVSHFIKGFKLH